MDWSPGAITRTYISPSRNHILWTPCICIYLWVVGGHPTDLILSRLVGHPFFWRQDLRLPSRKSSWLNLRNSWMNRWEILSHATGPIGPMGPRSPMSPKKNRNAKVQNLRLWEMVGVRVWWSKKASNTVSFLKAFGAWCGNYIFLMITFHSEWWWYATIFEKMIWLQEETSVLSALFINFLDINLNRDQKWWVFWDPGSSETAERWVYMGPAQHPRNWW